MSDINRIAFIENRDGAQEAADFASQCVRQYRYAVIAGKRKYGRGFVYRTSYIESYLFFKNYCKDICDGKK